jgi:hypothetical protein
MTKFPSESKRKRMPLPSSAYDSRYKEVFLRGRREPFKISFPSVNEAIKFRQRAQQYRAAVAREGDKALAKILYETVLRLEGRELVVEPSDAQFEDIFRAIGTTLPGMVEPVLPTQEVAPTPDGVAGPPPADTLSPPSIEELFAGIDHLEDGDLS